jgi:hypothetical protein
MGEDITGRSFIRKIEEWERERGRERYLKTFSHKLNHLYTYRVIGLLSVTDFSLGFESSYNAICQGCLFLDFFELLLFMSCKEAIPLQMHASCPGPKIKCVRRCLKKKKHIKIFIFIFYIRTTTSKNIPLKKTNKVCVHSHYTRDMSFLFVCKKRWLHITSVI